MNGHKHLLVDSSLWGFYHLLFPNKADLTWSESELTPKALSSRLNHAYTFFFLIPPTESAAKLAQQLIANAEPPCQPPYVIFCPQTSPACLDVLKTVPAASAFSWDPGLIPLGSDVLTLEANHGFRDLMLSRDLGLLGRVKESVRQVEEIHGKIPLRYAKGRWSCAVVDALGENDDDDSAGGDIDIMVMMDREVDLVTPLMMQMTYEGLIDELFGIRCGMVEIDSKIVESLGSPQEEAKKASRQAKTPEKEVINLLTDNFFPRCRDMNLNILKQQLQRIVEQGEILKKNLNTIQSTHDSAECMKRANDFRSNSKAALRISPLVIPRIDSCVAGEIDKIVAKRRTKQIYALQTGMVSDGGVAKYVIDPLELMICKGQKVDKVLRMMCLLSVINKGIKEDLYTKLTKTFVSSFGVHELLRLMQLERVGLFTTKSGTSTLNKAFTAIFHLYR
ncbi:MAG: hypothetical protein P4M11_15195 [Candidatus Pacebacteria bacterium]|nr:hypothetical protein [Candidatus Paceibacterota bacterium]